jgi:ABC-type Fe3+-hydroxamate transport system substrate-binding protein
LRREVTSVGGPKKLDVAKIRELNPDLIVANKEENIQHEIELLATEFPVWISDVYTLEDSIQMIQMLGHITNTQDVANTICSNIQQAFQSLVIPKHTLSVLYLIWKDPFMGVGKTTFIDDMLTRLGFQNAIQTERYPTINQLEMQPDLVFLSSEPYPFSEKHLSEVQSMFPQSRLFLVDGEYFTWYGSRMQDSPKYFQKLLNFIDNE